MSYEDTIQSFGFYPSGSCLCGGIRNEKYRNGQYVIYIRKTKNLFKIKRKNEVVVPLTNINELEKSLQETFPESVA